jgi:hypothetical protein
VVSVSTDRLRAGCAAWRIAAEIVTVHDEFSSKSDSGRKGMPEKIEVLE